jgi:hypothetical protein
MDIYILYINVGAFAFDAPASRVLTFYFAPDSDIFDCNCALGLDVVGCGTLHEPSAAGPLAWGVICFYTPFALLILALIPANPHRIGLFPLLPISLTCLAKGHVQ